jgi:hypothetical protein
MIRKIIGPVKLIFRSIWRSEAGYRSGAYLNSPLNEPKNMSGPHGGQKMAQQTEPADYISKDPNL